MAGQGNDFFLQFGSDAEPFSRKLATDLDPGIAKINALREALEQYEAQAAKSKSGSSPLGLTFEGLDQAAARIERATTDFSRQFGRQIEQLTGKVAGLAELLTSAGRAIGRGTQGGTSPVTGGHTPAAGSNGISLNALDPDVQRRLDEIDRAKKSGGGVTQVTPADQAAADKQKKTARETQDAANKAADANAVTAKQITETTKALGGLNERLRELVETAKKLPSGGVGKPAGGDAAAASADAALQIANTTANPVPVIVVGGEAQAAGGHPAHATHTPTASTATQTAKAKEEVAAVAQIVNAPNSFKNPRPVQPGDTVKRDEWWTLPGQEKPSRAFGLRKGETVGDYSARVEGARQRAEAALASGPHLDERSAQILREYQEGHGKLPGVSIRMLEKDKTGSLTQQVNPTATSGLPGNVSRIVSARDEFANARLDLAHGWALKELRQDPMLTQDSLPGDAKAALARIDSILAGTSRKTVVDQLFEGEEHPELAELRKGALNRNRLREQGAAAAEEARASGQAQATIHGRSGKRDPITGEWYFGTGMVGVNERRDTEFRSSIEQAALAEHNASDEGKNAALTGQRRNAQASRANAEGFTTRLNRLEDQGGFFTDPGELDESGNARKYTIDQLQREYDAMTAPLRRDLTEGVRRNKRNAERNYGTNPERYSNYTSKVNELSSLRDAISPGAEGLSPDEERYAESKSTLSDLRRRLTRDDLARQDRQGALPANERAALEQDALYQDYLHSQLPKPAPRATGNVAELARLRSAAANYESYRAQQDVETTESTLAATTRPAEVEPGNQLAEREGNTSRRRQSRSESRSNSEQDELVSLYRVQEKGSQALTGADEAGGVTGRFFSDHAGKGGKQLAEQYLHEVSDEYGVGEPWGKSASDMEVLHARVPRSVADRYRVAGWEKRDPDAVAQWNTYSKDHEYLVPEDELAKHKVSSMSLADYRNKLSGKTGSKSEQGSVGSVSGQHDWNSYDSSDIHQRQQAWEEDAGLVNSAPAGRGSVAHAQAKFDRANRKLTRAIEKALATYDDPGEFNEANHPEVTQWFDRAQNAEQKLASAKAAAAAAPAPAPAPAPAGAGGGGGGTKPPTTPAPPAAPEPEPEPERTTITPRAARVHQLRAASGDLSDARQNQLNALDPETQSAIHAERAALAGKLSRDEQQAAINRAAYAFRGDYQVTNNGPLWGPKASDRATERVRSLTGMLGLDESDSGTRGAVQRALMAAQQKHRDEATRGVGRVDPKGGAQSENELAGATERAARMEEVLASASGKVREARLAEIIAEENLARVRSNPDSTTGQIARANMQVSAAQRASAAVQDQADAEANKSRYAQLTGRKTGTTFGQDLLRHSSYALENTIGYSLVFTGFEKMREVVQTGVEAQAIFVRLQASLDANGIAAGNLQTALTQISATTATPLDQVTEAAAELSGTLKSSADIEFGTRIASQLANISQGALTAQQAAIGLRDVIAAFGDEWANSGQTMQQGMAAAGDQIAHLSQLTGVSVKDITEGTTQIAAEAHEFGLNFHQAATLAAYISKGTGESGEQSAAQASRMLATLYKGSTQTMLEHTRVGTNPNGSAKMVATPQQFERGDIGGVLTGIAAHWDQLSPRQKQSISAQMGTGIQARAFSAFVGGGGRAAAAMNGTANDSGALNKQNQSYLQTIAGMIKQLDEDFQNLGSTLQRLGAFDAIGVLAKSMDELLKTFNQVFGSIASFMSSNPITSGLMHWSTVILEAAAAWKLFGSSATGALVRAGALRGISPTNQAEIDAAAAAGTRAPRPIYSFGAAAGSGMGRLQGVTPAIGRGIVGGVRGTGGYIRDVAPGAVGGRGYLADLTPAGIRARTDVSAAEAAEAKAIAGRTEAETQAATAAERVTAAETAEQEAKTRLIAAEQRSGVEENELADLRAAQVGASEALTAAMERSAEAQTALATAAAAATVATEEVATATVVQAGVRSAGFMGGFSGGGSRLSMMAPLALIMGAGPVGNMISGGESAGDGVRGLAGSVTTGGMMGAGFGAMLGPGGAAIGAAVGGTIGAVKGILAAKQAEDNQASGESNQDFLDLMNQVYNNPNSGRAVQGANRRLGYHTSSKIGIDQLGKLSSIDSIQAWQDAENKYIDKHAADIAAAGGNNDTGKASIQKSIAQLKANLAADAERRIAELNGLNDIDNLNATQLQAMNSAAGLAGSLNVETMSSQDAAIQTVLEQSGLPTTSHAYRNLQQAFGSAATVNTVGINSKGEVGQYSADGKWHGASRQELAGLGPTEASRLPQLGNGPESSRNRLLALQAVYQQGITVARSRLKTDGLSAEDRATYNQMLTQDLSSYQQTTQQIHSAPVTQAQGRASILASLGGTPNVAASLGLGRGGDRAAVASLNTANDALREYNATLEQTDPQYWQNLQQIQQNKLQIAQLQNQPALNALALQAASATDATVSARAKFAMAAKQLGIDRTAGASSATLGQDRDAKAAAAIGTRQAQEAVAAATAQAGMAGIENSVQKARAQRTEALRLEAIYAKGGSLSDRASEQNAISQDKQSQIAIKDALEQQIQSSYDATAAWQQFNGDPIGAMYTQLAKAQQAYEDAVKRFHRGSQQANAAWGQVAQQRMQIRTTLQANAQAQFDVNAALDSLNGNALGAAEEQLGKAEQGYQQAVTDFGAGSSQARQAMASVINQRVQIRAMIQANAQAQFDVTAALETLHGDAVGASETQLSKAEQAYRQAVTDYGTSSSQARQAMASLINARNSFYQAQVDQVNSVLDLDIANLNARGQAGDAQAAARDAVQKVRNQINSYLSHGGQKGTKEYNDMMGQLATAQRTAFDTQLQAQLDTLDFQQQTYHITSAQEVQALQQILKNKQLTLAEQRSVTLKIKNLQESIRQELTQGGLNIPSDIKLPTAYEVRRGLGAGFGGAGTSVNTVNNNQHVTVHNNVPNAQVANHIANQVVRLINQQTSMGLRSSSSTPRTVATK